VGSFDQIRCHVRAFGVECPQTERFRTREQRSAVRGIGQEERAANGRCRSSHALESGPPEAGDIEVAAAARGEAGAHRGSGLASTRFVLLALDLDVHAHAAPAEVEHLVERERRLRRGSIVRDEEPAVLREPHVRLDLIASELERLLERRHGVLGGMTHRPSVSDATHDAILPCRSARHYC
jgi:hypothetical protein